MNKRKLFFLLFPLVLTSCGQPVQKSSGSDEAAASSQPQEGSIVIIDDNNEYDEWLNSWSEPNHLYFHYNRGTKGGYNNYCLWLWQHSPEDLEGALYAFPADKVKVSDKLSIVV